MIRLIETIFGGILMLMTVGAILGIPLGVVLLILHFVVKHW